MKHLFRIFSFLTLGLVSCTGCTKKNVTPSPCVGDCVQQNASGASLPSPLLLPDAGPTVPEGYQKLSGFDWELTVPVGWEPIVDEHEATEMMIGNAEEHNLILLVKGKFPGTLTQFVLNTTNEFHDEGVMIKSSTPVILNGKQFTLLDATKDGNRMWFWITVQSGVGYALSCGGPADEDHHEALCSEVAKTFYLK